MNKQARPKSLLPILLIGFLLILVTMMSASATVDIEHWFNNTLVGTGNTWQLQAGSTAYTTGAWDEASTALLFNQSNYYNSNNAYTEIGAGESYYEEIVFRCTDTGVLRNIKRFDFGQPVITSQVLANGSLRSFSRGSDGSASQADMYSTTVVDDFSWHYAVQQRIAGSGYIQLWIDGIKEVQMTKSVPSITWASGNYLLLSNTADMATGCSLFYYRIASNEYLSESEINSRTYYFLGSPIDTVFSAFNVQTGVPIQVFNVTLTNATASYYFNTSTGEIIPPSIYGVYDINVTSEGYTQVDYDDYTLDGTPLNVSMTPSNHSVVFWGYDAFTSSTILFNVTVTSGNYSQTYNNTLAYKNISTSLWTGLYDVVWDSSGKFNYSETINVTDDDSFSNYFGNATANISIYNGTSLYDGSWNLTITDTNNGFVQDYELSSGWVNVSLIADHFYYVFVDAPPFAYNNKSLNTSTLHQDLSFNLQLANSVNVSVYDESNNSLLDWANVTLTASYDSGSEAKVTSNGTAFFYELPVGTVSIRATTPGYVSRTYSVTVTDRSYQSINIYLASSTANVTFTVKDFDTNVPLVTAGVTQERLVGGSWVVITSQYSDISGTVLMSYVPDTRYRFTVTKSGYTTRQFILDPVIYSAYTIQLTSTGIPTPPSQDYGVSALFSPSLFYDDRQNNFSISFLSPGGTLSYYNYTITYPGGYYAASGTNAVGGTLLYNFNITGAVWGDTVNLTYAYITGGTTFSFSRSYSVIVNATAGTLVGLKDTTYGLGLYERVLIITLLIILIGGFISLTLGVGPGLIAGMFMAGIGAAIGFLPLWASAMMFVIGLFVLMMQGRNN